MVGQIEGSRGRAEGGCGQEHASPVFSRLAAFCTEEKLSDVSLVASCGRRLAGHRVILAASSDLMAQLVTQGGEVHCPDVDGDTMEAVLRFLYSSSSPLTAQNASAVLQAARKFGITPLEDLATTFLEGEMTVQSCCRLYARGEAEGLQGLKAQCLALAVERWDDVHQTEGFLNLTIDQLKGMLKAPELKACHEADLLQAACCWVLRDISRVTHLEELLAMVNFPRISMEELQRVQQRLYLKHQRAQDTLRSAGCASQGGGGDDTPMTEASPASPLVGQEPNEGVGDAAKQNGVTAKPEASTVNAQLDGLMDVLPLLLSLQAGKVEAGQAQRLKGVVPEGVDENVQVRRLQELLLTEVPAKVVGAPIAGRAQQCCPSGVPKGTVSGDVASQASENRAQQQECSDVVSGTCGQQRRVEAKSAVQAPGLPLDNGRAPASSVPPLRTARCVCQVEGCSNNLTGLRDYHVRYKICDYHLKVSSIVKDGHSQRFCQQCGRFHALSEFDGNKRSCRSRLMRHNARRRKRLRTETEAFQVARAAMPTMCPQQPLICLVSATPSTTGRGLEVPASATLAGALLPQADYLSVIPQVSQTLAFAANAGAPMDSILVNKLTAPVCQMVSSAHRGSPTRVTTESTAALTKNDLAGSLVAVDGVKEEGKQGVVH